MIFGSLFSSIGGLGGTMDKMTNRDRKIKEALDRVQSVMSGIFYDECTKYLKQNEQKKEFNSGDIKDAYLAGVETALVFLTGSVPWTASDCLEILRK